MTFDEITEEIRNLCFTSNDFAGDMADALTNLLRASIGASRAARAAEREGYVGRNLTDKITFGRRLIVREVLQRLTEDVSVPQ
jgi:hypothetical protein